MDAFSPEPRGLQETMIPASKINDRRETMFNALIRVECFSFFLSTDDSNFGKI